MRCARWLALALAAVALGGCETTAEKSAQLKRQAKRVTLDEKGLSITHESAEIKVVDATVVHDSERAAAVVTLRNGSAHAQRDVPIAIVVKDARGRDAVSEQRRRAGRRTRLTAVDRSARDRDVGGRSVPATGAPASVSARVGEAPSVASALPQLMIGAAQLSEDPASGTVASGSVRNASAVKQRGLVVFAVGRRAGRVVAAGRAIVPELAAGASAPFQVSLVGDATGAQLQFAAPPSSVT